MTRFYRQTHARTGDPATSHEAADAVDIAGQARQVLRVYLNGNAYTDHDAYRLAGLTVAINGARQRCTDLRHAGLIERTGDRGATPSGRAGYLCRITPKGRAFLNPNLLSSNDYPF
jgi:hypothetical protein